MKDRVRSEDLGTLDHGELDRRPNRLDIQVRFIECRCTSSQTVTSVMLILFRGYGSITTKYY